MLFYVSKYATRYGDLTKQGSWLFRKDEGDRALLICRRRALEAVCIFHVSVTPERRYSSFHIDAVEAIYTLVLLMTFAGSAKRNCCRSKCMGKMDTLLNYKPSDEQSQSDRWNGQPAGQPRRGIRRASVLHSQCLVK